ncbi:MAG: hypothetical protein PWQ96_88 [Clostridia bacterium]|jgi:hypothetical protein|nr:hypothetical protein [Clostridiales bacterium]MDK2984446.1 hypothetical protein [Clostridia bacterium]
MIFKRGEKIRRFHWIGMILYPLAFLKGLILGRVLAKR